MSLIIWAIQIVNFILNRERFLAISPPFFKSQFFLDRLKKKIIKFRDDELEHKDIAYEGGATKSGLYGFLDKVIKTSSRIAITISEKI